MKIEVIEKGIVFDSRDWETTSTLSQYASEILRGFYLDSFVYYGCEGKETIENELNLSYRIAVSIRNTDEWVVVNIAREFPSAMFFMEDACNMARRLLENPF